MRASRLIILLLVLAGPALAQSDDAETRLRDQLKRTTIELRDTQDENAALKAKEAAADRAQQDLAAQLTQLKQALADAQTQAKGAADAQQQLGAATARATADEDQIQQERGALSKWQDAYKQAADVARTRDTDAKRLAASGTELQARLDGCAAKNLALYQLGLEILDRYQKKDLGDVLGEAEPFTQLARVKLENAVQDYQDKLRDQKLPPERKGG